MSKQAIEGRRVNGFALDPDKLTIVGLDTEDGPEHPLYDKRIFLDLERVPKLKAMIESAKILGILKPILVRKDGDKVLVLDGRQRVRVAREVNKYFRENGMEPIEVECRVKKGGGDAMAMGIMIASNELTVETDMEDRLDKLTRFITLGKSEDEAAVFFGVEKQTIHNWLLISDAGPAVRKAITDGLMSASAAAQIAALPRAEQAEAVKLATADGKATVKTALNVAKAKRKAAQTGTDTKVIIPPSKRLLKKLVEGSEFQQLDVDAYAVLKWVTGEISADRIKGLTALIRKIEGE